MWYMTYYTVCCSVFILFAIKIKYKNDKTKANYKVNTLLYTFWVVNKINNNN